MSPAGAVWWWQGATWQLPLGERQPVMGTEVAFPRRTPSCGSGTAGLRPGSVQSTYRGCNESRQQPGILQIPEHAAAAGASFSKTQRSSRKWRESSVPEDGAERCSRAAAQSCSLPLFPAPAAIATGPDRGSWQPLEEEIAPSSAHGDGRGRGGVIPAGLSIFCLACRGDA